MCWRRAIETKGRPCVLLLHGFPELAYSWRKVMPELAAAGYHVIAPDQRGYGRTTGWDADYDGDLASFRLLNLVRDALGLVSAFGYRRVDAVVGHDFGTSVAAWCALVRPDVFRSVVLMSAPFAGPPPLPFDTADAPRKAEARKIPCIATSPRCRGRESTINGTIRRARPTPTCTARRRACTISCAPTIITRARTGKHNKPYPLQGWTASELAKLPTYYVMDLATRTWRRRWRRRCRRPQQIAANRWLPDHELAFYSAEYARNGFQGGLQWYRCGTSAIHSGTADLVRPHHRRALLLHLRPAATGAPISARACSRRCRRRPAPA